MTTATAETAIIAWENAHAGLIVWGTHDPLLAIPAIETVYIIDHGFPRGSRDFRQSMPSVENLATARRYWASPEVIGQETWEEWQYGPAPKIGWVPYLFLAR